MSALEFCGPLPPSQQNDAVSQPDGIHFFTTPPPYRKPPSGEPSFRSTRTPVISDRTALDLVSFGPVDLPVDLLEQPTLPTTPVMAEATAPDIYQPAVAQQNPGLPVHTGWVPVEVDDDLDEITATDGVAVHPDYVVALRGRLTAASSDAAHLRIQLADANSRHAHARDVANGRIHELTQNLHTATEYARSAEDEALRLYDQLTALQKRTDYLDESNDQLRDDYDALRTQLGNTRTALSRKADVATRQEDVIVTLRTRLLKAERDCELLRALPAPTPTPQEPSSRGFFSGLLRHLLGSPA